MKPELEAELRATVASLRIKVSCHELLLLALLPELAEHQKSLFGSGYPTWSRQK